MRTAPGGVKECELANIEKKNHLSSYKIYYYSIIIGTVNFTLYS